MSDLAAALQVAIRAHAKQVDKQGEPYLLHVLRVVEAVAPDAKVVAALHDVAEDGGDEGRRMLLGLDLSEAEAVALALITRDKRCSYESYIAAINSRPRDDLAREVKLADLRDNFGRIPFPPSPAAGLRALEEWERGNWQPLRERYVTAITILEGTDASSSPDGSEAVTPVVKT